MDSETRNNFVSKFVQLGWIINTERPLCVRINEYKNVSIHSYNDNIFGEYFSVMCANNRSHTCTCCIYRTIDTVVNYIKEFRDERNNLSN